jgi:hypothetical protein
MFWRRAFPQRRKRGKRTQAITLRLGRSPDQAKLITAKPL